MAPCDAATRARSPISTSGSCVGNSVTCGDGTVQDLRRDCAFRVGPELRQRLSLPLRARAADRMPPAGAARQGHGRVQGSLARQEGRVQLEVRQRPEQSAHRLRLAADHDQLLGVCLRHLAAAAAAHAHAHSCRWHVRHQAVLEDDQGRLQVQQAALPRASSSSSCARSAAQVEDPGEGEGRQPAAADPAAHHDGDGADQEQPGHLLGEHVRRSDKNFSEQFRSKSSN